MNLADVDGLLGSVAAAPDRRIVGDYQMVRWSPRLKGSVADHRMLLNPPFRTPADTGQPGLLLKFKLADHPFALLENQGHPHPIAIRGLVTKQ